MEWNAQTQKWVIGGAIVLILLVGGWWFFTDKPADDSMMKDEEKSAMQNEKLGGTSDAMTMEERPSVSVNTGEEVTADDQSAGDSVKVVEARLSRVSWIAIRDDLRIYGAARVTPPQGGGTVTDVTVPLLKNTEPGTTYKVVVYADDGDGVFDFKKDALVTGLEDTFSTTQAN